MKILDKYILKNFVTTFATVFVILLLIFILQTVWLFISELAGKDLDVILILKFLLFKMPSLVPLVLPLSVLLASIMTFGDLAENYEFAAMKSAGISLQRIMKVLTLFILVLSFAAFFFANNVIPYAEYKFINFRKDIAQMKPAMAIAEGQFSDVGSYNIKVDKKSGENGNFLTGVTIHKKINFYDSSKNVIKSRTGELISNEKSNILKLVLNDGYYYEDLVPKKFEERKKLPFAKSSFKKYIINIDLSKLNSNGEEDFKITNTNTMLNVNELLYTLDSLNKNYRKDIISIAENIYQRNGINTIKSNQPVPAATALKPDVLSNFSLNEKSELLQVASNTVTGTTFSIESSRDELRGKSKNINNHWIALYDKFVIAFACLLMFFIGAPLGAIIRKGGLGLPIVFAVLIFIIFHFINTFGKKVAQENGITPFLGCWMSTMVLLPLAVLLTYRATNDISFISMDAILTPILNFFKKLFPQKELVAEPTEQLIANLDGIAILENDEWEKLKASSDNVLINIVKNSKQFNYTDDYRNKALKILDTRGISQSDLIEKSSLNNAAYDKIEKAHGQYKSYTRYALVTYALSFVMSVLMAHFGIILLIIGLISLATFYYTLYKSYENLQEMEKLIGKRIGIGMFDALLCGFPLYIIIYFYNKSAIKEAIAGFN